MHTRGLEAGSLGPFPEEPREGQQGIGLGRAEGFPGLWRGLPPQNLRSLHLLCEDASQPMASTGAPSRPPPSAPPRPACHGARRTQGPAPGDIACVEELAGFRAVHPRRRLVRPPEPTHDCCLRTHRPGVEQCGERETPRSQPREQRGGSEHRARARRRRQSLGARARGGGGAHVRVFVSGSRRTRGPQAQGSLPLRICAGHRASHRGSLSTSPLLFPFLHPQSCPSTSPPAQTHWQEKLSLLERVRWSQ